VQAAVGATLGRVRDLGMSEDAFARHRSLLFTVAYARLRLRRRPGDVAAVGGGRPRGGARPARPSGPHRHPSGPEPLARRREEYVGEWLPEPLLTSPDVAADVELAESVSIAMLTVLETLGPAERAVFVLREVFDIPYEEIAEAVGKSPAAVRQIAHRARDHVAVRRPRMPVSTTEQREAVDRFLAAIRHGDLQGLLDVLAPDVVVVSDGGGLVAAARRPIEGAVRVAGLLLAGLRSADFEATAVWLNGSPAIRLDVGGQVDTAVSLAVEDGRITRIYAVRNPHKLARLHGVAALTRT
jgi:RNA polymerase sigma factor (sigma-70 family)